MRLHSQSAGRHYHDKIYRDVSLNDLPALRAEAISHVLGRKVRPEETESIAQDGSNKPEEVMYKTFNMRKYEHLESFKREGRRATIMYFTNQGVAHIELA